MLVMMIVGCRFGVSSWQDIQVLQMTLYSFVRIFRHFVGCNLFIQLLLTRPSLSIAGFTARGHLVPNLFPLFAPGKGAVTDDAHFGRQVFLFDSAWHGNSSVVCGQCGTPDGCTWTRGWSQTRQLPTWSNSSRSSSSQAVTQQQGRLYLKEPNGEVGIFRLSSVTGRLLATKLTFLAMVHCSFIIVNKSLFLRWQFSATHNNDVMFTI